ncbi:hypothetical protein MC7420_6622 [Coleofasciculus chthonoplastes PCC 7420]|uniref:Uncharacterized protein n=1 Tax=Coleofasciculus chthonoplastes PCC 7420 TaxID=118168 RepID=B4W490_9CYAN|nr:hypothetical protein MC7420_6622 [Coleofasciculus chthonoplastes PCC 7420]
MTLWFKCRTAYNNPDIQFFNSLFMEMVRSHPDIWFEIRG